jgi:hypothetical protein
MKNNVNKSIILFLIAFTAIVQTFAQQKRVSTNHQNVVQSKTVLPFWNCPEEKSKKGQKMDAVMNKAIEQGPFKPSWESLRNYQVPDWYRDAKFGIFMHWGPETLNWPGKADGSDGGRTDYKSRANAFKGEKFDALNWSKLLHNAGVKYILQVIEHHDAYALYNSSFTPWSSVRMAPKRDFAREMSEAARHEGLIYGISSHTEEHYWFYANPPQKIPPPPQAGRPSQSQLFRTKYLHRSGYPVC